MYPSLLLSTLALASALSAFAAPLSESRRWDKDGGDSSQCSASPLFPEFPTGQDGALNIPDGVRTVAVALGVGEQIYSCLTDSGTHINTAHATLYDVHQALLSAPDPGVAKYQIVSHGFVYREPYALYNLSQANLVGSHSFVPFTNTSLPSPHPSEPSKPNTVELPHFELTRTTCPDSNAGRITAQKVASMPSPLSPPGANVPWAQVKVLERSTDSECFAKWVYRTDSLGGAQPRNCSRQGQVDKVNYAALYWFLR